MNDVTREFASKDLSKDSLVVVKALSGVVVVCSSRHFS
jgi:hypothetical protein